MPKITTLTDEHRARLGPFADAWIGRVLRTGPCTPDERATVEDGMRRCYEAAGLAWHGRVVWVESPLVGALATPLAAHLSGTAPMHDAVYDAVGVAVIDAVHDAVRGAVGDAVGDAVGVGWWVRISPWWSWDAWRAACVEIIGVPHMQHLVDMLRDANGAGWWWPHRDFVVVSDRPTTIHREQVAARGWGSHRLHNPTGPSIAWAGWELYHWHGTRVPAWVIDDCTIDRIQAEQNTEVRRCAIEAFGWARFLEHIDATLIDDDDDPGNPGHRLRLFDIPARWQPFDTPVRMLVMENASLDRDGTRRRFSETVPAEIGSAVAAAAWQFGVSPDTYRTLARAT